LEDFLLIIQKFESIKEKFISFSDNINKYNSKQLLEYINIIRIKLYDLYEFYMSCSIEGKPQHLFISKISKNCLHYYSVVLLLSIGLSYVISQKIKTTIDYNGKLLILLNLQEKAFMTFCDAIIKKLNDNYQTNIWVIEIIKKLNNQLISNADTVNHILQIKMLSTDSYKIINDILINMYIFYNKNEANKQEIFLYNYFHNKDFNYLTQFNINEIEELFDKNIFKAINLRSNYANIASLKSRNKAPPKEINKNTRMFISRNENKDIRDLYSAYKTYQIIPNRIKVPYLDFPSKKKYTLVLDLDETMVSFKFTEISLGLGKLHLRPGLEEFLEELKNYFEIIVFTSGTKEYADTILNIIEQKSNCKFFDGLLYREHTTLIGKKYIKDLSKLGRDLSKTIIVDNLPQSFKLQRENGILINSFYGDNMNDKALYELKRILINIYNDKSDVRDSIFKYKEDIIKNVTCIDGDDGKN
jgi:Dullard-like phosphatase family protein